MMPATWHGVILRRATQPTDHRKLSGYETWQREVNKNLTTPTETTTVRSICKVLSHTFPDHLLSLLYLFLFLILLLFKTHTVSRWQRSWNAPWNCTACSLQRRLWDLQQNNWSWFHPDWILILYWGQSKQQKFATELLDEQPFCCRKGQGSPREEPASTLLGSPVHALVLHQLLNVSRVGQKVAPVEE